MYVCVRLLYCAGAHCPVSHDLQSYTEESLFVQGCSMPSTPGILTGMRMNTNLVMLITSSNIAYSECNDSSSHDDNQVAM